MTSVSEEVFLQQLPSTCNTGNEIYPKAVPRNDDLMRGMYFYFRSLSTMNSRKHTKSYLFSFGHQNKINTDSLYCLLCHIAVVSQHNHRSWLKLSILFTRQTVEEVSCEDHNKQTRSCKKKIKTEKSEKHKNICFLNVCCVMML